MSGVEAGFGIRMQDCRAWDPSFEQRNECFPAFARPLTAASQSVIPQSIDALPEGIQRFDVAWHCVVLVITGDYFAEPCAGLSRAIMHSATKLDLDGL